MKQKQSFKRRGALNNSVGANSISYVDAVQSHLREMLILLELLLFVIAAKMTS